MLILPPSFAGYGFWGAITKSFFIYEKRSSPKGNDKKVDVNLKNKVY
jgi:hypothetical protein